MLYMEIFAFDLKTLSSIPKILSPLSKWNVTDF